MERKFEWISREETKTILENLKNVNGAKPIELIVILDKIGKALERGEYNGEIRNAAIILRHFDYPLFSLPYWRQSEIVRAYPEAPKAISEMEIREMFK